MGRYFYLPSQWWLELQSNSITHFFDLLPLCGASFHPSSCVDLLDFSFVAVAAVASNGFGGCLLRLTTEMYPGVNTSSVLNSFVLGVEGVLLLSVD
jgi:hypothetical protein